MCFILSSTNTIKAVHLCALSCVYVEWGCSPHPFFVFAKSFVFALYIYHQHKLQVFERFVFLCAYVICLVLLLEIGLSCIDQPDLIKLVIFLSHAGITGTYSPHQDHCPSSLSHREQQKQLKRERFIWPTIPVIKEKSRGWEFETPGDIIPTVSREQWINPWLLAFHSSFSPFWYNLHVMHREWCRPQWLGVFILMRAISIIPRR